MREDKAAYGVVTFHSTYSVLKAEKLLKDAGLDGVRLIPVPSQISSDCGVTVRFRREDTERAQKILSALEDDLEGYYTGTGTGWEPLES